MKRKMVCVGIPYAFGLFCASFYNSAAAAVCLLFLAAAALAGSEKRLIACACAVLGFGAGFGYYRAYDAAFLRPLEQYNGKEVCFTGKVTDADEYDGENFVLTLRGKIEGRTVRLKVGCRETNAEIGDKVSLNAKVSLIENTYGYAARDYAKANGIVLEAYANDGLTVDKCAFSLVGGINSLCGKMKSNICRMLPNAEGGMLCAMLFGDKSGLDEHQKDAFSRSGIGHIMATSGLHLIIVVNLLSIVFARFFSGRRSRLVFTVIAGGCFAVCAGMSASIIRAYIMLAIANAAPIFHRKTDTLSSISAALVLMTLFSPYAIASPSLVLSASGAFASGVFAPAVSEDVKNPALKTVIYSLCVTVCVFPPSLLYFDEFSLVSPLMNIICVPLCSAAICLGLISALLGGLTILSAPLLAASGLICKVVLRLVEIVSRIEFAAVPIGFGYVSLFVLLSFGLAVVYSVKYGPKRVFRLIVPLCAGLLAVCCVGRTADFGSKELAAFSRGKGALVVFTEDGFSAAVDFSSGTLAGSAEKYLSSMGIAKLDCLVLGKNTSAAYSSWESCFDSEDIGTVVCVNSPSAVVLPDVECVDSQRFLAGTLEIEICGDAFAVRSDGIDFCVTDGEASLSGAFDAIYTETGTDCAANAEYMFYYDINGAIYIKRTADGELLCGTLESHGGR